MSVDEMRYGSVDPFPFKLTVNGVGVDLTLGGSVPATALVNGDLWVFGWTQAGGVVARQVEVLSEITKLSAVLSGAAATASIGCYFWTPPTAAEMQINWFLLNAKDADAGGAFDENAVLGYSHGHPLARFNGT